MKSKAPFASRFLNTFAQHWKTLFRYSIIGAFLLLAFSFIRPQIFESTATVLPPEKQSMGGMMAFLASSSSALDILKGEAASNPALEQFKTVIDSRSVAEEVAQDPSIHVWFSKDDTSHTGIVNAIQAALKSEALRTGMLTVSTSVAAPRFASSAEIDSARKMSAYLTNKYVQELDRFNRDRLLTSAHNTRVFVEQEHKNRLVQLDSAYARLQQFQEAHQAIALTEQLGATVAAAAKLTGRVQELEMQRNVEERELGAGSPRIRSLDAAIEAAKEELQKYDDGGAGNYVLALKDVPALSREFAKLVRETKVLEQVTAYLRQELEQDRVNEQRDLPSLQMLDAAQPPLHRSSPSRGLHVLTGLLLGLIVGTGVISTRRFKDDVRDRPEVHYRFINFVRTARKGSAADLLPALKPQSTGGANGAMTRAAERA